MWTLVVGAGFAACGGDDPGGGNAGAQLPDGGTFNQCGVAAPPPADTGACTAVHAPLSTIADFDDYVPGTPAGSYTYYVNGKPPAADAVLGGLTHVGDGSDMNGGTSVITTEMVAGAGGAGYALQIASTNATNWGGLLLFYFIAAGTSPACIDAGDQHGVQFSIRGSSPSGRFGVSVGLRDTTPISEGGLCDNATASDCKTAAIEQALPSDPATWTEVKLPWDVFTPGVGSGRACVPLGGQNITRLVIQPFMSYPPPDFKLAPGPYTIAVDNLRFY